MRLAPVAVDEQIVRTAQGWGVKGNPVYQDLGCITRHSPYVYYLRTSIDIPFCHHERWDGSGYPRGLKGDQIPIPARIFAVMDVWDALCSHRIYRDAWTDAKAREYIRQRSGVLFDPKAVQAFFEVMSGV